jgi:hypothetical protein
MMFHRKTIRGKNSKDGVNRPILAYVASALLIVFVGGCASKANDSTPPLKVKNERAAPHYEIDLSFTPGNERWSASVRVAGAPCRGETLRLYLHRDIVIGNAVVDQRSVIPILDPAGADRIFVSAARAIDLPCPKNSVTLTFDGPAQLHKDGRNQISADLIELSLYGAWYPLTSDDARASWTMTTRLPSNWRYATPARIEERVDGGGISLRLVSREPSDVVFIASPHFDVATVTDGQATARVFVNRRLGDAQLETAKALGCDGANMTAWLEDLFGPTRFGENTRPDIVFTLRGGPLSYARLPIIVLREETLSKAPERSERLNIRHEVAHFWSVAKGAQNEWINEGLAEFLAVMRTGDVEGATARAKIIAGYRAQADSAGAGEPLATAGDDGRGFINRYVRPTLMLDALEGRAGRTAMVAFLRKLTALGEKLDADSFARAASETIGEMEGATIARCIRARDWPLECGGR